jgi:hypothetical protein
VVKDAKICMLQISMLDKALMKLNKSWRLADAPASNKRMLGKFKLVESVAGYVKGYSRFKTKDVRWAIWATHEVLKSV